MPYEAEPRGCAMPGAACAAIDELEHRRERIAELETALEKVSLDFRQAVEVLATIAQVNQYAPNERFPRARQVDNKFNPVIDAVAAAIRDRNKRVLFSDVLQLLLAVREFRATRNQLTVATVLDEYDALPDNVRSKLRPEARAEVVGEEDR